jgi:surface carbohydrate biosynthesis protein
MIIYIPLENYARELDGKILLAGYLANKGHTVIVGDQSLVRHIVYVIKCDIYIGKHLHLYPTPFNQEITTSLGFKKLKSWFFDLLKQKNVSTIYTEEEGDFSDSLEKSKKNLLHQCDPLIIQEDDYIATWGIDQARIFKNEPSSYPKNIIPVGNIRFDLYKDKYVDIYKDISNQIVKDFGKFILINTNYSFANNSTGVSGAFKETSVYSINDDSLIESHALRWEQQQDRFSRMIRLIFLLSIRFKNLNIVVRPHPGEAKSTYLEIFKGIKNIFIKKSGSVGPWLKACELLIHDGCTTGLEANLMGKNIIAFSPINPAVSMSSNGGLYDIGTIEKEIKNVLKLVEIITTDKTYNYRHKRLESMIPKLNNLKDDNYSVDILGEIVEKINKFRESKNIIRGSSSLRIGKRIVINIISYHYKIFTLFKYVFFFIKDWNFDKYNSRKEIRYDIEKSYVEKIVSGIHLSKSVKIKVITNDIFIIFKK